MQGLKVYIGDVYASGRCGTISSLLRVTVGCKFTDKLRHSSLDRLRKSGSTCHATIENLCCVSGDNPAATGVVLDACGEGLFISIEVLNCGSNDRSYINYRDMRKSFSRNSTVVRSM